MHCNILLIYPPHRERVSSSEVLPLGMAYLASFLRSRMGESCKITIWDLNIKRITQKEFKDKLYALDEKPDIIGIGGIVTVFRHFLWMSKVCKEVFPEAVLAAGGSLASTTSQLLFRHTPVDMCVRGEGEFTFFEIIKNLLEGADKEGLRKIEGLFLWDKNKDTLIETPLRRPVHNLDIFGMPAYDLLDMAQYAVPFKGYERDLPREILSRNSASLAVMTSRGCIGSCTFCYRQFSAIGMNSTEFIKKHIFYLNKQYGVNIFDFMDELFNVSEKRIHELYSCFLEIKEKIPGFYFRAAGRAERITVDLLRKLKKVGCFQFNYGLESGSDRMLQLMEKGVTADQNRRAVLAAKEAGLHCVPQFVIGLPGETRETLAETIKFIESIDIWSYVCIHKANAYPGSQIYSYAMEKGLIRDEFAYVSSLADSASYPLPLAEISEKEMSAMVRRYLVKRQARLIFRKHNALVGSLFFLGWVFMCIFRRVYGLVKEKSLTLRSA